MLRYCGVNPIDMDDLLQVVFMLAYQERLKLPARREASWLRGIARKQAANFRRRHRHWREELNQRAVDAVLGVPEDPEEAAALRDALRVAIAGIAEEDLEILVWYGIDEETLDEIGQRLGLSKSGAHVRLSRARRLLADSYAAACAVRSDEARRADEGFLQSALPKQ